MSKTTSNQANKQASPHPRPMKPKHKVMYLYLDKVVLLITSSKIEMIEQK